MTTTHDDIRAAGTSASTATPPWTNVYGVARSLLAMSTLLTLLAHDPAELFRPLGKSLVEINQHMGLPGWSLFAIVRDFELARMIAIGILVVVVSGWRPRVTGLLHWWVAFSYNASAIVLDGGDQVCAILSALLVPVCLTDSRRWHWSRGSSVELPPTFAFEVRRIIATSALFMVRLQIAIVYLHAGTAKTGVAEWANGTALYYWFLHPTFGAPDWLRPIVAPVLSTPLSVTLLTWSSIAFELVLFLGLALGRKWRAPLLVAGLFFHSTILVVHGLASFSIAMAAALVLYLRPMDERFRGPRILGRLRALDRLRVPSRPLSQPSASSIDTCASSS